MRTPFRPTQAPDGVHVLPRGAHRDLRAVAGLADDLHDLDGLVVDLGDLELEDLLHELRVVARQHDLQARGGLHDLVDQRLDPVIGMVDLPRGLVLLGEDPLRLAEVDVDVAVALALVVADDHLTDLVLVLRVQRVLLDLPQALARLLLGALHGDPVELLGVDLDEKLVPDLALLVQLEGFRERDLVDGVVQVVVQHDLLLGEEGDLHGSRR